MINAGRVPRLLQEPLSSAVNDVAARAPLCVPAPAPPTASTPAPVGNSKGHDKRSKDHKEKDD